MNASPFLLGILLVLVPRRFLRRPDPSIWSGLFPGVVQALLLLCCFERNLALFLLVTHVLLLQFGECWLLAKTDRPHLVATLFSTLFLLLLFVAQASTGAAPGISNELSRIFEWVALHQYLPAPDSAVYDKLLLWTSGAWIAAVELNHPVALFLKSRNLLPPDPQPVDEVARGRIVGMLERVIVLMLTLSGQLNGISLLLAAKGLARFKDMEKRAFAEYVLIGTLLSIGAAILLGLLLRQLS